MYDFFDQQYKDGKFPFQSLQEANRKLARLSAPLEEIRDEELRDEEAEEA